MLSLRPPRGLAPAIILCVFWGSLSPPCRGSRIRPRKPLKTDVFVSFDGAKLRRFLIPATFFAPESAEMPLNLDLSQTFVCAHKTATRAPQSPDSRLFAAISPVFRSPPAACPRFVCRKGPHAAPLHI